MNKWINCFVLILIYFQLKFDVNANDEFNQIFVDRYLFSPFANESNLWPKMENIRSIWQIQSLNENYLQSSDRFWFLAEHDQMNSSLGFYSMSLFEEKKIIWIQNIQVKSIGSFLLHLNGKYFDHLLLISSEDIQIIQCNPLNSIQCQMIDQIIFPDELSNRTRKIFSSIFIPDKNLDGWIYFGSDSGLHGFDLNQRIIYPNINQLNISIFAISWTKKYQQIFFGTETKLWIENYQNNRSEWRFEHINGLIDYSISSLIYHDQLDQLWIGHSAGITILSPLMMFNGDIHWYFTRLDGHRSSPGSLQGHLSLTNITCLNYYSSTLNSSDQSIWFGSIFGLMRFHPNVSSLNQWRMMNSGRYLPNRDIQVNISSLIILPNREKIFNQTENSIVAVTNRGLSVIYFQLLTLERKTTYFQDLIDKTDRHVKYGFVSDCQMSTWANPQTCVKGPNDNDGLWTSMYLSSQIFRYFVLKDKQVKEQSWKHFQSLYFLNQITGISGYPARSLALKSDFPPQDDWYPSPINSSYQFKGDTSSDEIVGHEYVYPLVYHFLAETPNEREQALEVLFNITNHILTHDWYLIGEKGKHTTWGIWNPREINDDSFYQESRGLNSLQILAFLFQTYSLTGDERFYQGIQQLIVNHQYDINLINQKMIALCDGDFSDDELAYLTYFNFYLTFYSIEYSSVLNETQKFKVKNLLENVYSYLIIGLNLSHQYKQIEKAPFYNFIYCFVSGQTSMNFSSIDRHLFQPTDLIDCQSLINDSIWYLQRWPLDLINYRQYNQIRLDININDLQSKCGSRYSTYSRELLPPDERSTHKWNGGQFDLDDGDGFNEEDPTSYLLSYWGMRFFQLISK